MITGYCLGGSGSILALTMNEVPEADYSPFEE
jgi:dienelactone hydrolase